VLIHLLAFPLLEVLLVLLAGLIAVTMIAGFGGPWDARHSRCPACGAEALSVVEAGNQPGRLEIYRCSVCGAAFRKQLDGTLAAMPVN